MIGGTDQSLEGKTHLKNDLETISDAIRDEWPDMIIESEPGNKFYFYSDEEAKKTWNLVGEDPTNTTKMIFVTIEEAAIAFCSNSPVLVDDVIARVKDNR